MTPADMTVVTIREPGGPDVLALETAEMPVPGVGELLIAVRAAGVNRPDIAQRLGRYPVPADANPVPGLEVSGTVAALGEGVSGFAPGQTVFALAHGGGYASHCIVDARQTLTMPDRLSFVEAAAIPEVAFTVEFNMMMRARLCDGEAVLIHGGASGIGAHAIQRAKAAGARVYVTVGSEAKRLFCLGIGADGAFNYKEQDWSAELLKATNGAGVDVILDMVGGGYVQRNIACLAPDGRYALISLQGGRKMDIDLDPVLRRRLTLTGSTLRPLSAERKAGIASEVARAVLPLIEQGAIKPTIFKTFPLECVADAHRLLESGEHMGKIVLTVEKPEHDTGL